MKLCLVSIVIGVMTWATGPGELTVTNDDTLVVNPRTATLRISIEAIQLD